MANHTKPPDGAANIGVPGDASRTMMSLLSGAWVTQAIFVVAKLGIPDLIARGIVKSGELAAAAGAHPPSLHRVMRALVGNGIFSEVDGVFGNTPLSERLQSDVAGSLRAYAIMNGEQWVLRSWGDIEWSVRTGQPAFDHVFGAPLFDYYNAHPEAGAVSAAALSGLSEVENAAIVAAGNFPAAGTIVDVGGGHGSLLTAILRARPGLHGVLLERQAVASTARANFAAAQVDDRCEVVVGDFFSGIPPGGDVYVLKKIIHDWNDEAAHAILTRCRNAMSRSARLLIAESIVPQGNGQSPAKWLDLLMLVYTGGRERTAAEYRDLVVSAGFADLRLVPTASNIGVVEAWLP